MGFEEEGGRAPHEPLSVWILMANRLAGTLALPLPQQFLHSSPAEGNLVTYLPQKVSLALNCTKRAPRVEVNAPKLEALNSVWIPMEIGVIEGIDHIGSNL